jgi:hypothetical protein
MSRITPSLFVATALALVATFLSLPSVCGAASGVGGPPGPGGGVGLPPEQNGPAAYIDGVNFYDVPLGTTSKAEFTVTSTGDQPLIINGISFTGPNAADFSVLSGGYYCSGTTRYYDDECSFIVEFTPTVNGPESVAVTLEDNEPVPSSFTPIAGGSGPTFPTTTTEPTVTTPAAPATTTSTPAPTTAPTTVPTPPSTTTTRNAPSSASAALTLRSVSGTAQRGEVRIRYVLDTTARVKLSVSGPRRKMRTVLTRTSKAGSRMVVWNGKRAHRGRYTLRLTATAGGRSVSRHVTVQL